MTVKKDSSYAVSVFLIKISVPSSILNLIFNSIVETYRLNTIRGQCSRYTTEINAKTTIAALSISGSAPLLIYLTGSWTVPA